VKAEYLLPCECGQKIRVGLAQAGQVVHCSCGRAVEAPTLLAMRALEPAVTEVVPSTSSHAWGARQRMILIGSVVIVLSVVLLACFSRTKPLPRAETVKAERIQSYVNSLTLLETYRLWEELKLDLARKRPVDKQYDELLEAYHRRMGIALVVLGLGVLTVVAAFFVRRPNATSS
jgi:hypothetical protein